MQVGTALWAIAFVLLLPFYGRLEDDGHLWWLWTCVAGFGLGPRRLGPLPASPTQAAAARRLGLRRWPAGIFYTATTLDGFIADEHDSLAWLFEQKTDEGGPAGYDEFIAGIGAMVMGSTTYAWIRDHMAQHR